MKKTYGARGAKTFPCGLHYHSVLATKDRRKVITAPLLKRLREIFAELAAKWECRIEEFNGEADHVRLLVEMTPKVQPSVFVNNLKTVSSRLIRRDFGSQLNKVYWKPVF